MASSSNRKARPALLGLLLLILNTVACGGGYTTNGGKKYPLVDITLQPGSAPSISVAGTVQVGANAVYQVSSNELASDIVTTSAAWSSSNTAVATVVKGLVTGAGIGSATITASLDGKKGQTLVVVGQTATLDITATGTGGFSLSTHPDQQFKASASYPDSSVLDLTTYATWNSSVPGVLKFYDPYDYAHGPGEAMLLATGTTTITASLDSGEVGSLDLTVVP
jgi:hypothetical protein